MSVTDPERITIEKAATMLNIAPQGVRVMVQNGLIDGARCWGPKYRRTYYVTDAMIINFKRGGAHEEE